MAESNEKSNQDKAKRALKMGIKRVIPAAQEDSSTANFINKLENEVQLSLVIIVIKKLKIFRLFSTSSNS